MAISADVQLGENVNIFHPDQVNLYGCSVGAETKIGSFVEIQKHAVIGARCKISSHTFICEGVTVEDEVFIGHGVMFTNDLYPRATTDEGGIQTEADWVIVKTHIKHRASIGSNATILAGITIGQEALVGAGSVVTHSVPDYKIVAGVPARIIGDVRHKKQQPESILGGRMINVGVVGYGYWGPNLVRNFMETPGSNVLMLSDLSAERLKACRMRYPTVEGTQDFQAMLANPKIDLVAVATPVSAHYDLALQALQAGKHVLVEKPMTATSEQAKRLVEEAHKQNRTLAVDHTFVYTGAVRKMKDLVDKGELGDLYYYHSNRINLGLFQHDVSVIWDLAVHDLAIMDYILPYKPVAVSATGMAHISGQPEDVAYLTIYYENSFIAHLNVNWLAPVKVRRTMLSGSRKMIVYDDLEPSEKIKVYDKGLVLEDKPESIYKMMIGYRTGDMWSPKIDVAEALKVEVQTLINCIEGTECLVNDGGAGLRVVRILEAATESLARHGEPIRL